MGLTFYNNWKQSEEFKIIDLDFGISDGCLVLSIGIIGLGFVLAISYTN